MKIKERVYNLIRDDDDNNFASNLFDGVIITLIIVNVIVVIADTFSLSAVIKTVFYYIELISVIVFTIEYLLRVWTSDFIYKDLSPVKAQPEVFSNAFDSLWWAVATLTTVGYGDIYPITILGKILSGIIAVLGIGLVAIPTGIISAGFIEQIKDPGNPSCDEQKFCPYCGHEIKK